MIDIFFIIFTHFINQMIVSWSLFEFINIFRVIIQAEDDVFLMSHSVSAPTSMKCEVFKYLLLFCCCCFSLRVCLRTQTSAVCGRLWTNITWASFTQLRPPSGCWWSTATSRCRSESFVVWLPVKLNIIVSSCFYSGSKCAFSAKNTWKGQIKSTHFS